MGRPLACRFHRQGELKRVYATSVNYGKAVFGRSKVRDITPADVRRLLDHICERATQHDPPREVSPATLAKHLRQLSACFEAAISEGYATENPCRNLHKTARPRGQKSKPSYYTDGELGRLWPQLEYRPLFLNLCKLAVLTGLRFGELAALDWSTSTFSAANSRSARPIPRASARPRRSRTRGGPLT